MCQFLLDCIIEPSCYSEGLQAEANKAVGNTTLEEESFLLQGTRYILSEGQTKNKAYSHRIQARVPGPHSHASCSGTWGNQPCKGSCRAQEERTGLWDCRAVENRVSAAGGCWRNQSGSAPLLLLTASLREVSSQPALCLNCVLPNSLEELPHQVILFYLTQILNNPNNFKINLHDCKYYIKITKFQIIYINY